MLKDTDIHLKKGSDAIWLSLWTGKGQRGKICFFFLVFTKKTVMSHLIEFFSVYNMLCVPGCLSFSSPKSVELYVLNKIMCLSECVPSVFDEIAPSYTDSIIFSSVF